MIDPIDGTFAFTRKIPEFCVVVGYQSNKIVTFCVIYDPIADELYTAERGYGVSCNGNRIISSKARKIPASILIAKFEIRERLNKILFENKVNSRNAFSAQGIIYLLKNQYDATINVIRDPWDRIHAIFLEEYGLTLESFDGEQVTIDTKEYLAYHPEHKPLFRKIIAKYKKEAAREGVGIK